MTKSLGRFILSLCLISSSSPMCFAQSPSVASAAPLLSAGLTQEINTVVPNFGVVSNKLLRGGQPREGGLEALKKAGVNTIVNLRDGLDDIDGERQIAHKLGLKFVSIPMSVFKTATPAQVDKFLKVVSDNKDGKTFVHCRQGMDRCGTMVAMYRMNVDSWTAKRAYGEMLSYGFHPFLLGLRWSVFANEQAVLSAKALATPALGAGQTIQTDLPIQPAPVAK